MKQLSTLTKTYLAIINILGGYILISNLDGMKVLDPGFLAILALLGGILHVLKVEGPTNRSHFTISFIVFGFTLALSGSPDILIVILVANLFQWLVDPPPAWYIQPFNIGCYLITAQFAGSIYKAINPYGDLTSPTTIIAIVASAAGFTLINHLIVGIILWLARGENFKRSGVFDMTPLLVDLTMLSLGASLAIVWVYNPYALLLFLVPVYPFYKSLKIPALERKTETDPKTGLFNHGYFMAQLKHELVRANRYDRPLAIIMADLDLLRNINNTYGHLAGDEVLKGIATILRTTVREYDVVARFGGEEFAILMPEATSEKALERAEFIRKTIESNNFVIPTSVDPIRVTMSLGVATREDFEQSGEEIIHNADTALYHSKVKGRNLVFAHTQLHSQMPTQPVLDDSQEVNELVTKITNEANKYLTQSRQYPTPAPEGENTPSASQPNLAQGQTVSSSHPATPHASSRKVYMYIAALTLVAFITSLLGFTVPLVHFSDISHEWIALAVLIFMITLTEGFSISLYVGNTSISTTAVPLVAGFILFGPFGTILCSAAYAVTAALKFKSPFNRLIFNFSNHVIAGMLINIMISTGGQFFQNWNVGMQLLYTLASSIIIYSITTSLISIGMGIDLKKSPFEIWKEQYQWMALYYIGIGFVSYSLIFGYKHANLLGIVFLAVPLFLLRFSQAQYVGHTRDIVNTLRSKNQDLEQSANEITELNEGLLTTLSEIIDLRDPYVLGHSKQVGEYATGIAKALKINQKQIELVRKAGLLHDIGKLGIPMNLLTKPSSLTTSEYEIIKKHAALGSDLIKNTPSLRPLARIIRHHHERYDGMGYPDKIAGNQIGIEARIMAVADAIEAMSSDRPYRRALKPEKVMEELKKNSGTQFDPLVVDAAIKMLDEMANEASAKVKNENRSNTASKLATDIQTS
jgi:diguanylate cyclase (GGDEF)-like protein/putative nucleotidyltransferase with HDIG domain